MDAAATTPGTMAAPSTATAAAAAESGNASPRKQQDDAVLGPGLPNAETDQSQSRMMPRCEPEGAGGRRIVAESSKWNLSVVEPLKSICLASIVSGFHVRPSLEGLPQRYRSEAVRRIALDIPIPIVISSIPDEEYWRRRALAQLSNCDVAAHGGSWKRLYCERTLETEFAQLYPRSGNEFEIILLARQLAPHVHRLHLPQMLPERVDPTTRKATDGNPDHLDPDLLVSSLENLRHVSLFYGPRDAGMAYQSYNYGMTANDGKLLSAALKLCRWENLALVRCLIDDSKLLFFTPGLLGHPTIVHLDLSNNLIGDDGAEALASVISSGCALKTLLLSNNKIGHLGATYLAKALALKKNGRCVSKLVSLSLRLNPISDMGGKMLIAGLVSRVSSNCEETVLPLDFLDLCASNLGLSTLDAISDLVKHELVREINISCNIFNTCNEEKGPSSRAVEIVKNLTFACSDSKELQIIDLRETDLPPVKIQEINAALIKKAITKQK